MNKLYQFDRFLGSDGPAALVIRQWLMPVEGPDGVLFPATFAAGDGFPGGYNIDTFPDGTNVCLVDSVGSQANRIEPIFAEEKYRDLVPQFSVKAGEKTVSILEAGHRAGDALLRCSSLHEELRLAFQSVLRGDTEKLAKLAPTSLVFGVWDSRDTQAKLPRLVSSTIRAFNVRSLKRGAVYIPPLDYSALEVFTEEDKQKAEGNSKSPLAARGFVHNPASGSHGGVIATGGIRRDAVLSLAALRLLKVNQDTERTRRLQRYILGLALISLTHQGSGYLRQGCLLVLDPGRVEENEFVEVEYNGTRKAVELTESEVLAFASEAAKDFEVHKGRQVDFDKARAKRDVQEGNEKKGKKAKKAEVESSGNTEDN